MSINKQQKVLDYIKRSGVLISNADKNAQVQLQKQAAIEKLIPEVVDALIENHRIPADLRDKAANSLKDPLKTLEILASVAAHRNDTELNHMGKGEKQASAPKVNPNYVGARTAEPRESDKMLEERILGNRN